MDWTLNALVDAFAPVDEIGDEILVIPVGSTTISMRILLPEEDSKVQAIAASSEDSEAGPNALDYIERHRLETLSRAIIAVGDKDFRDVAFIETGDVLDNGKKVTIPVNIALRNIILKWPAPVRTLLIKNYSDLLYRVEREASEKIKYDPADLETELERAKAKVARLESEIENRKKPMSMGVASGLIHSMAQDQEPEFEDEVTPPIETPPVPVAAPKGGPRVPVQPRVAPPPVKASTGQQAKPPMQPGDDIPDSFIDPGDVNAIDAENRRLFEEMHRKGQGLPPAPSGINSALDDIRRSYGNRRAPHMAAADTVTALASETFSESEIPDELAFTGRHVEPEMLSHRAEVSPVVPLPKRDSKNPRFNPGR